MNYKGTICLSILVLLAACQKSDETKEKPEEDFRRVFTNSAFHEVVDYKIPQDSTIDVKNVILMIGDGMGPTQVSAGVVANKGKLNILKFPQSGLSKTHSSDSDITDSAAGATALACGIKTYNGP